MLSTGSSTAHTIILGGTTAAGVMGKLRPTLLLVLGCVIGAVGCAARRSPPTSAAHPAVPAAASFPAPAVPAVQQAATLPLERIMPPAVLPAPATRPAAGDR